MQKENFKVKSYYIEIVDDVIVLCYVNIPVFCREFLCNDNFDNLKARNIFFTPGHFQQQLLDKNELDRLNTFKTLKKQVEWIAGRFAIKYIVKNNKLPDCSYHDIVLDYMKEGAPYIKGNENFRISITHSHDYAIGGLVLNDDINFGIDIEKMQYINEKTIPDFFTIAFSPKELENLKDKGMEAVYKNWTIKEAFLKLIQRGFHEPVQNIEVFDNMLYYKGSYLDSVTCISNFIDDRYAFSVLYEKS